MSLYVSCFSGKCYPAIVTSPEFEGPLNSRRRCVSVNTFRFAFRFWVQHKRKKCSFEVEWAEYQPDWRDVILYVSNLFSLACIHSFFLPFFHLFYLCLFLSLSSVYLSLSLTSTCLVTFLYLFLSVIQLLVTLNYLLLPPIFFQSVSHSFVTLNVILF